ncbi:MAG: hypothetical protein K2L82_02865 [Lachnospiraceae bacterium]|nr:hypothetical protein [Lachnospiraceae bacterium]
MRVVPRIIITIRPGMQKCVPGLFCAIKQSQKAYGAGAMYERMMRKTYDEQRERGR